MSVSVTPLPPTLTVWARGVEREGPEHERGRLALGARPSRAPEHGAHAGDHLHHAEGLDEIVVRSGVEARYLIVLLAARGGHYDGHAARERGEAYALQYLQPVLAGQHDVEDYELWQALFNRGEELLAVLEALGLEAGGAQGVDLYVADGRVVLYAVNHVRNSPSNAVNHLPGKQGRPCQMTSPPL